MTRRPLGELVAEFGDVLALSPARAHGMHVTALTMMLPLEVTLQRAADDLVVTGDAPRWRWRTPFDREPGHLTLYLREEIPR